MYSTKQKTFSLLIILFSILFVLACSTGSDISLFFDNSPEAKNGVTEYALEKFQKNETIRLNGEWVIASSNNKDYAVFPESIVYGNNELTNYELLITVPKCDEYYALMLPSLNTETALYINDEFIYKNMNTNINKILYNPQRIFIYYATDTTIKINLLVRNTNNILSAKGNSVIFGNLVSINNKNFEINTTDYIQITLCLIAFLYFLIVYLFDRTQKRIKSFALLCLYVLVKTLFDNYSFLFRNFPELNLRTGLIIQNIILSLTIVAYLRFIIHYYYQYLIKPLYLFNIVTSFALVFVLPFIPLSHYIFVSNIYAVIIISTNIMILLSAIRALRDNKFSSLTYFFATLFILIGAFIDVFDYYTHLLSKTYFICSFSLFIILMTYNFVRRNAYAYSGESALAKSLGEQLSQAHEEENNFLASHLRAHFLFNALNIISGYALFDAQKSKKITASLKIYLKQLLEHDNLNELTSISNEIELLRAFGYIEEERFPNLKIIYDIPSNLPDFEVPSLILQPLLENAVNHGIRKKSSKSIGTINISITPGRDYVDFSIKDDGAGTEESVLKKSLQKPEGKEYNSLYQIQSRLTKLYNEKIIYRSVKDIGTVISFKIPISN